MPEPVTNHDERTLLDELGTEIGTSVLTAMRPYSVDCPVCLAPVGTCCLTGAGTVLDEPHRGRVHLAERRYGRVA